MYLFVRWKAFANNDSFSLSSVWKNCVHALHGYDLKPFFSCQFFFIGFKSVDWMGNSNIYSFFIWNILYTSLSVGLDCNTFLKHGVKNYFRVYFFPHLTRLKPPGAFQFPNVKQKTSRNLYHVFFFPLWWSILQWVFKDYYSYFKKWPIYFRLQRIFLKTIPTSMPVSLTL